MSKDIVYTLYTGNFDITYSEILDGCSALLNYIIDKEKIQMP